MFRDERPLILKDGSTLLVRASRREDAPAMTTFAAHLGVEEGAGGPLLERVGRGEPIEDLCDSSEPAARLCLVALRTLGGHERIVGAAGYVRQGARQVEAALGVDAAFRGQRLATGLAERLAIAAAHHDVRVMCVTARGNSWLVDVFQRAGFPQIASDEAGVLAFDLGAIPDHEERERSEMRDRLATAASIRPFFHPRAVAVIGASRDERSLGARTLHALVTNRFQGPVFAVNPHAASIGSIPSYPSISALPRKVDLALVLVRAPLVIDVVNECAAAGVRAVVVITAGFAETGKEGRTRQDELLRAVRGHGMRMVGPNCMGLINADPAVRLSATFAQAFPPPGDVAMSSQSGAMGLAVLATAERLGIGLSSFVSVGNKADVSANDLLQYWEYDTQTKVILLYLESFGNPRRFARIARRVGRDKPIVVVKSGRTRAGKRAAGSHTAALAGSDEAAAALFRQTGVIRSDTMEGMFDLALVLSSQPLPEGRRVAILTNAGGPGILCADACVAHGLEVAELPAATTEALDALLPPEASVGNPVDMIASAGPQEYRQGAELLLRCDAVDALIVIYAPIEAADLAPVEDALAEALEAVGRVKPVLSCLMGEGGIGPAREMRRGVPSWMFPEAAARVLGKVADYARWRSKPPGVVPPLAETDWHAVRAICRKAIAARGTGWLSAEEVQDVLAAAGLPGLEGRLATTAEEAVAAAAALGYPVAMKLASLTIVHKSDLEGVKLDLADADAVTAAFEEIRGRLQSAGRLDEFQGVWLQPMLEGGVEVMAGMTEDPVFGPVVAFGLGGVHVEVLGDVVFRVTPLTDEDARQMVKGIRGRRLLEGYRGHAPADTEALVDLLLRIARLADEAPEIDDLDLNPIFAYAPGEGCCIPDARIHVRADSELS